MHEGRRARDSQGHGVLDALTHSMNVGTTGDVRRVEILRSMASRPAFFVATKPCGAVVAFTQKFLNSDCAQHALRATCASVGHS